MKDTKELLHELRQSTSVQEYLKTNQDELYNIELKDYLHRLLEQKNLLKADVITNSGLHQIYAYQIFSGKKSPSRDKLIAICFGMNLTLDESQGLLKIAEVAPLHPRNLRDCILLFAIEKQLGIMQCNEMLYELNEFTLA